MTVSDQEIPAQVTPEDDALAEDLAARALQAAGGSADLERHCWVVLHTHVHGVPPVEYDIREIPEALYLQVLDRAKALQTEDRHSP